MGLFASTRTVAQVELVAAVAEELRLPSSAHITSDAIVFRPAAKLAATKSRTGELGQGLQ
jgi:hypothetical protein